jgi:hypothetical protein
MYKIVSRTPFHFILKTCLQHLILLFIYLPSEVFILVFSQKFRYSLGSPHMLCLACYFACT